ncbi:hypothetical protein ACJX0J_023222, partial [Zea mays]
MRWASGNILLHSSQELAQPKLWSTSLVLLVYLVTDVATRTVEPRRENGFRYHLGSNPPSKKCKMLEMVDFIFIDVECFQIYLANILLRETGAEKRKMDINQMTATKISTASVPYEKKLMSRNYFYTKTAQSATEKRKKGEASPLINAGLFHFKNLAVVVFKTSISDVFGGE